MLWRKRFKRWLIRPVTGFLTALLFWQASHEILGPNIIPALINVAEAAYNTIQPNGDGTTAATQTTCGGAGNYDCVNDGVATSSTPSTTGDYLTFSDGQSDYYLMETLSSVNTVSKITVPVYHIEGANSMALYISLWDASETTQYGTEQNFTRTTSGWDTAVFSGLSLNQSQLDGLRVRLLCQRPGGGKKDNCTAYDAFASVSYNEQIDVTVSSLGNQQDLEI